MVNASDVLDKCALRDFASWIFMDLHGSSWIFMGKCFWAHSIRTLRTFWFEDGDNASEISFLINTSTINENQVITMLMYLRSFYATFFFVAVVSGSCVSRPVGRTQLRSSQGLLLHKFRVRL